MVEERKSACKLGRPRSLNTATTWYKRPRRLYLVLQRLLSQSVAVVLIFTNIDSATLLLEIHETKNILNSVENTSRC